MVHRSAVYLVDVVAVRDIVEQAEDLAKGFDHVRYLAVSVTLVEVNDVTEVNRRALKRRFGISN